MHILIQRQLFYHYSKRFTLNSVAISIIFLFQLDCTRFRFPTTTFAFTFIRSQTSTSAGTRGRARRSARTHSAASSVRVARVSCFRPTDRRARSRRTTSRPRRWTEATSPSSGSRKRANGAVGQRVGDSRCAPSCRRNAARERRRSARGRAVVRHHSPGGVDNRQ